MNISSTWKGEQKVSIRSLFTAVLLMVVALAAVFGLTSTKAFAAENNTSINPDKATEVVLTSRSTGDVAQPITDADYAKLNAQYKVTPDGTPTIQSKTQNVENLTTKDGNKNKSYTKTTTKWVITDENSNPVVTNDTKETPDVKVGPNVFAPITLKPSVPALIGGAVLGAVPALAAVPAAFVAGGVLPTVGALAAVPAAFVAGGVLPTVGALAAAPVLLGTGAALNAIPAALTGAALNAIPAALTGAALNAIPAALTGAALNAIPAALTGAALNAIPAALTGAALNAIPAALTGAALNAIPAFVAGALANALPAFVAGQLSKIPAVLGALALGTLGGLTLARLPLQVLGALHAIANPLSFGGPLFRAVKGFLFPATEIVKDHLEDALLAAIPALINGAVAAVAVPAALFNGTLALLNGAIAAIAVPLALLNGAIAAVAVPLALLNGAIAAVAVPLALLNGAIAAIAVPAALLNAALLAGALGLNRLNRHLAELGLLGTLLGLMLNPLNPLSPLSPLNPFNPLNPLNPFNPFVGTGLISLALRALRTIIVALTPALALALPTLFATVLAILPAVLGLLAGVVGLLVPGVPGLAIILGSLGLLLAPILNWFFVALLAPVLTGLALAIADLAIQAFKDVIRAAVLLGAALFTVNTAVGVLAIALFALGDGVLDSVFGIVFALLDPLPIGSLLAVPYVFLNMTEAYLGGVVGIATVLLAFASFFNLALLEVIAIID